MISETLRQRAVSLQNDIGMEYHPNFRHQNLKMSKCPIIKRLILQEIQANTGRENVYMNGAIMGLSKVGIGEKFDEIAAFADIGEFIEMPLRTYSTGMQMRLAFSIATLQQPEILVMDEWLTVGDADFQEKAQQRLDEIIKKTSILVIATHSPELVQQVSNRMIRLERGTLIAA